MPANKKTIMLTTTSFRIMNLLTFIFQFDHIPDLPYRVTLLVQFEGPQGLPQTDISDRCMVVHIAGEQTLVSEDRRFFAFTVTVNTVQDPGNLLCSLISLSDPGITESVW